MINEKPAHFTIIALLQQIRAKIHERLQRGEINYKSDMFTLEKHLQIAHELGYPRIIGETHHIIGLVESRAGNFQYAELHFTAAFQTILLIQDYTLMASIQSHLGELYYQLGELQAARQSYQNALHCSQQANNKRASLLAGSNLGLTLLALQDYPAATQCFEKIMTLGEVELWMHLPALVQAQVGMAEIQLVHQDIERAWHYAKTAELLAQAGDDKYFLSKAYFTQAHIAEQDPAKQDKSKRYMLLGRDALLLSSTITLGRGLLEEARYRQRRDEYQKAQDLAQAAYEIFRDQDLQGEMRLAELILRNHQHG